MIPAVLDDTAYYAWYGMARESWRGRRIKKTNNNNQVRVTWEKKEKQTMNSITKLTLAAAALRRTMQTNTVVEGVSSFKM